MERLVPLAVLGFALLTGCQPALPPTTVALIVVDTLRADHVGAYGSPWKLTPHLDAIAEEGVVFSDAVATSSWTRSSVASMLTARYPSSIQVFGRDHALAPSVTTLAEVLKEQGYATLAVSSNANAGALYGFARGFDHFTTPELTRSYPDDLPIHTAEGVTTKALELLDQREEPGPVFLFLHYIDPHDPYLPQPGILDEEEPAGRFDGSRRDLHRMDRAQDLTDEDRERIRFLYRGEIRYCDRWIGALLRGLEERELLDDALLVITSDHGEGLWDHGVRAHGRDLYEEMIRVPLIVRPARASAMRFPIRVDTPVSLRDIAPTILDAAAANAPESFRGRSLWPLIDGSRADAAEPLFSELQLDHRHFAAVRDGDVKLIENRLAAAGSAALELYDLSRDPGEQVSLATVEDASARDLLDTLNRWTQSMADGAVEGTSINASSLDEATLENLRALGYLGAPSSDTDVASVIDFADPDHAADQLISGFYDLENQRRWMAGRASVSLGRSAEHTKWQLEGWIDLDLVGVNPLVLDVRVDGKPADQRVIDGSGFFLLSGALPPASGASQLQLDIACNADFVPAHRRDSPDERHLCTIIRSVGLR